MNKTYEFDVEMSCEGCSNAVNRILSKNPSVSSFKIDLPTKKVFVTSNLGHNEILECIKKTGKTTSFSKVCEN